MLLMESSDCGPPPMFEEVETSFAERLREHEPLLRGLARRLAKSASDGDDLVQDTLERALRKAHGIEDKKLRAWLVTVLNNLFIDQCRQRKRRPRANLEDIAVLPAPEKPDAPARWQTLDGIALKRAVDELPAEFAVVYRLHAFDGKNYIEIATELGIAKATVGTRLLRARKRLKKILTAQLASKDKR